MAIKSQAPCRVFSVIIRILFIALSTALSNGFFIKASAPNHLPSWPRINAWYEAMDGIQAYACRVRGDGLSWRKVLYREPWWPSEETWHPRDTVGPKGELKASEDKVMQMFGDTNVSDEVWKRYLLCNPHVAKTPNREAAACIIRRHEQILADFMKWSSEWGYEGFTAARIDRELRRLTITLSEDNSREMLNDKNHEGTTSSALLAYFDDRLCIPRDMGPPAATKLRQILGTATHEG